MPPDRWYRDGLSFACTQCGHCCTTEGYVWVDRHETRELADHLKLTLDEFGRRFLRRVGRRYALTDRSDGACVFWDDGCTVYAARPRQCRTFPFWKENVLTDAAWREVAGSCEGVGEGRLYLLGEIEELAGGKGATADGAPSARERRPSGGSA